MKIRQRQAIAILLAGCAAMATAQQLAQNAAPSPAPKPKVTNAKLQELSAAAGLEATVNGLVQKQTAPLWIGYRIPAAAKDRTTG